MNIYFVVQIIKMKNDDTFTTTTNIVSDDDNKIAERKARSIYHRILADASENFDIEYAQVFIRNYSGDETMFEMVLPQIQSQQIEDDEEVNEDK